MKSTFIIEGFTQIHRIKAILKPYETITFYGKNPVIVHKSLHELAMDRLAKGRKG